MSRAARWLLVSILGQALVLLLTAQLPGFGARGWHHVASLLIVLGITAGLWRWIARSRALLVLGVVAFSLLAVASGFWLLYWKESVRAAGYQDWGVFWHVAWSWAAAVFFFLHTWINRVTFAHFFRRSFQTPVPRTLHVGAYVLVVSAFFVTWSQIGQDWFTVESYIPFSLYAWLLATTPPYVGWFATRRASPQSGQTRRARTAVDLALVPAAALAVLSGIPLTWFDPVMDANGWKYVSKFWHVWPSVVFSVLVFVHTMQFWSPTGAHWRRINRKPAATATGAPGAEAA